jgi:hypothetical protein
MRLVGTTRVLSPVLAVVGPRWERRNWVGLKGYLESGRRIDPEVAPGPDRRRA